MIRPRTCFCVLTLFIVPLVLLGVLFAKQAAAPKRVAFLVGINEYEKPGFDTLRFAERDVGELKVALDKLGFRTVLLKGSAQEAEQRATRDNIERQLKNVLKELGKRDTILLVLSGHGVQFKAAGQTKEDAFFCPVDAVWNDPEKLFSLSYLIDEMLAPHAGKKLVLVDACRDAPDPTRGLRGVQGQSMSLPADTAVFFSCRAGQQAIESDKAGGGHGVFTYCLLDGLRGKAADDDGELTWTGLVKHVEDMMEKDKQILEWVGADRAQEPIPTGNVGRTLLGRVAERANRFKREHAIENVNNQIAKLRASVATVNSRKATLELARSNLKRGEELARSGAISKEDLDVRRQTVKVDEAAVDQALQSVYAIRVGLGLPAQPAQGHDLTEVPADLDQKFSRESVTERVRPKERETGRMATGTWKWTRKTPDGQEDEITATLKQDGEKLTGNVASPVQEAKIEDGKVKDGQVSFQITFDAGGKQTTAKFSGKLDRDKIKGKVEIKAGDIARTVDWETTRAK
jgi:hypothetical protein